MNPNLETIRFHVGVLENMHALLEFPSELLKILDRM